jgi:hypothetical protein
MDLRINSSGLVVVFPRGFGGKPISSEVYWFYSIDLYPTSVLPLERGGGKSKKSRASIQRRYLHDCRSFPWRFVAGYL